MAIHNIAVMGSVLAKIFMVTKPGCEYVCGCTGSVLAKIFMVTKRWISSFVL